MTSRRHTDKRTELSGWGKLGTVKLSAGLFRCNRDNVAQCRSADRFRPWQTQSVRSTSQRPGRVSGISGPAHRECALLLGQENRRLHAVDGCVNGLETCCPTAWRSRARTAPRQPCGRNTPRSWSVTKPCGCSACSAPRNAGPAKVHRPDGIVHYELSCRPTSGSRLSTSSSTIARTASAGSDSGCVSDTHSASGTSIGGATMRHSRA